MKIGFIIFCRYNSTRLPGKILKEIIPGKTVLDHLYIQLNKIVDQNDIIIGTSEESTDTPIKNHCELNNYNCFRGNLDNVSLRLIEIINHYQFDYVVRINGDNLFIDHNILQQMVSDAISNKYDFLSSVPERTFPYGMSLEMVKSEFYKIEYPLFSLEEQEHVTLHFYNNPTKGKRKYYQNTLFPDLQGIKLAIDTDDDFNYATLIANFFVKNKKEINLKNINLAIKTLNNE